MASPTTDYGHSKVSCIILNVHKARERESPYDDAALSARDTLLQAYSFTKDRNKHKDFFDLLDVFRCYTEKGEARFAQIKTLAIASTTDSSVYSPSHPAKFSSF